MTNQPESTFYRNLRSIKDGLPEPVQACLPFIDEYWERFVFGFPHEFTERKEGDIWAAMEKLSEILGKKVYDLVFPLSDELLRGRDFFFWQIQKFITHG